VVGNGEDEPLIQRLKQWGEGRDTLRAMILTSSRARPNGEVDLLSDYDVILVDRDIHPYFDDRSWLGDFGDVLVVYRDPIEPFYGFEKFAYITQYVDGTKIDFTLWQIQTLQQVIEAPELPPDLDIGYQILLDKDDITQGIKPPTYMAYIPFPPNEEAYQELIEVFFHEATDVAKYLWRDDLIAAKYSFDHVMKMKKLRTMLEWRIEIDHNWSLRMGAYGRGLKKWMKPETWSEFESTYVGPGMEDHWEALFKTILLFRRVAIEVGDRMGYSYLKDLDRRVMDYLHRIRDLNPHAESFPKG
jgi:aminoglycoside 6-adenylyltransferase